MQLTEIMAVRVAANVERQSVGQVSRQMGCPALDLPSATLGGLLQFSGLFLSHLSLN